MVRRNAIDFPGIITRVLLTHATTGRPTGGDHEYHLWAIGTGWLCPPASA